MRKRERGTDTGRGRSMLHAGSLMWDLIPGLQDHTLDQRQALNRRATPGSPIVIFLKILFIYSRETQRERERKKERQREAETQAEGEAGSMQGARRGTQSRDSGIMAPGRRQR